MIFTVEQARKYAGFSQAEMAKKMNICRDTYRNLEKNPQDISVAQASKISEITGVPFDNIFFGN